MAAAGVSDILITTEIVGDLKLKRLAQLLKPTVNRITVVVDSKEGADALNAEILKTQSSAAEPLAVLIEVNVGQNRCGVEPGQEVLELANYINNLPGLHLVGLQGYEGHLQHVTPASERRTLCLAAMSKLEDTVKLLNENSIKIETVTTGGTGTAIFCSESPVVTEVQPGSFIFMDTSYQAATERIYDSALSVLTTVISKPKPNRAVIDAGTKSLSTDMGNAQPKNLSANNLSANSLSANNLSANNLSAKDPGTSGQILYRPAGDEHGILECLSGDMPIAIGDRIEILPSHIDTTVNLHDVYFCHRQGTIEQIIPITARGKVQ
jgi:D-serine deaminase-like pyridoxal phosphate-dependent protein